MRRDRDTFKQGIQQGHSRISPSVALSIDGFLANALSPPSFLIQLAAGFVANFSRTVCLQQPATHRQ